ncbi:MAG TPA: hypothetical protein DIW64_09950, partial [Cellvibrio sp.]|nr:hypothetical protein [Cellvibrio sp.]
NSPPEDISEKAMCIYDLLSLSMDAGHTVQAGTPMTVKSKGAPFPPLLRPEAERLLVFCMLLFRKYPRG